MREFTIVWTALVLSTAVRFDVTVWWLSILA